MIPHRNNPVRCSPAKTQGCVVIFLSNFLALLIKVHSAEGQQTFLGGIVVAINVLLFLTVLLATWFATQQAVDDHREGENAVAVAGTMLTFELQAAASSRSMRERVAASRRSIREQAPPPVNSASGRSVREKTAPPVYSASAPPSYAASAPYMREQAAPPVYSVGGPPLCSASGPSMREQATS